MSRINQALRLTLALLDLVLGLLTLVWPGVWHEAVHGSIERTTFYVVQALGVTLLVRGAVTLKLQDCAALYAVGVPGALFLAWNTAETGAFATAFYCLLAGLWLVGGYRLRAGRSQSPSGEDSTGVDLT